MSYISIVTHLRADCEVLLLTSSTNGETVLNLSQSGIHIMISKNASDLVDWVNELVFIEATKKHEAFYVLYQEDASVHFHVDLVRNIKVALFDHLTVTE